MRKIVINAIRELLDQIKELSGWRIPNLPAGEATKHSAVHTPAPDIQPLDLFIFQVERERYSDVRVFTVALNAEPLFRFCVFPVFTTVTNKMFGATLGARAPRGAFVIVRL